MHKHKHRRETSPERQPRNESMSLNLSGLLSQMCDKTGLSLFTNLLLSLPGRSSLFLHMICQGLIKSLYFFSIWNFCVFLYKTHNFVPNIRFHYFKVYFRAGPYWGESHDIRNLKIIFCSKSPFSQILSHNNIMLALRTCLNLALSTIQQCD